MDRELDKESARLTAILTARFMMNLQDASRRLSGSAGGSNGAGTLSSARFDRVVGSIGESLGPSVIGGDIYGSEDDEGGGLE